jgi:ABC-type multidrug transport system ATPase subunit
MIALHNICFKYRGSSTYAIIDLNLRLSTDDTYIIVGENGSGKTTLIKIALGLLKPSAGLIDRDKKLTMGYLPDSNGIYDNMTVLENIKFRLGIYSLDYPKLKSKVCEWLEACNLADSKDRLVGALSMGMKKKAAIICACITMPDFLALDEPTGGVDDASKSELAAMLKNMRRPGCVTLCASHDADFIDSLGGTIVRLGGGL